MNSCIKALEPEQVEADTVWLNVYAEEPELDKCGAVIKR